MSISVNSLRAQSTQFKANHQSKEVSPQTEPKKMSTTSKVMIGLGAVATAVIAGVAIKKAKIAKDLAKQFAEDKKVIDAYSTQKSKNAGKTVEETIANILGKDSKVKPHTYNVTEEYPIIPVYRDRGGYKDGAVTTSGIIDRSCLAKCTPIMGSSISQRAMGGCAKGNAYVDIYSGVVGDLKNKVVQLDVKDPQKKGSIIRLAIISPTSSFTPVQKDLLKLAEHPEKVDRDVIDKIVKFVDPIYTKTESGTGKIENRKEICNYENLDYDLILSAIQSMAR